MALGVATLLLGQMLVAALLAATTWAAGSILSAGAGVGAGAIGGAALRRDPRDPRDQRAGPSALTRAAVPWALTMALGFALVGQLLLLIGMVGQLRALVVLGLAVGIHVAAIPAWGRLLRGRSWLGGWAAGGVAVVVLPSFLLTLYPPLGFDQTMYHLPYARAFATSGALPFLPALRFPIFPQLAEVINAAVLIFAGDVATQTTGWLAMMAGAGVAYVWARELGGDVAAGWLAVGILIGSPIALYLASTGYVEPLLALFIIASLYAAERGRLDDEHRAGWLVAAGLLAGSAASVKYLGLYVIPAAIILVVRRAPWRILWRDLAVYGIAATIALLPTYGRLVMVTGNPLFPFYPEWFGANPWGDVIEMVPHGAARWPLVVTRLWDVTFRRELVGQLPPYSPAFVLAVPIILVAAWRDDRVRRLLLVSLGFLILAPTHAHYLLAIGPLWSVVAAASTAMWWRARTRVRGSVSTRINAGANGLIAAAVIIACGGEAYALYRLYRLGPPPVTADARDRLIASQRPLYPAVAWLNRTAGPVTVYAVHAEQMVDYASGTLLGDFSGIASFARMEAYSRKTGSVAAALDTIAATHLLVPTELRDWNDLAARDPQLTRVYGDEQATVYRRK
jgi:Dolichyl-phosphate-mannose-protein mannosyltransferase